MIRLRSAALGLALLAGSATVATAQTTAPAPATGQDAPHARGERAAKRGRQGAHALFRGVKLTDAQQAQVKGIHAKYQPQYKALADAMRPALQEARAARQRGDTTAARTAFARTEGDRAKLRALREQESNEIRDTLTPDQRATYDKNAAQLRDRVAKRQARGARKA